MTFWRISETKECVDDQMRENLTLVEYMEWYARKYGKGVFTYPDDWSGFNVDHKDFKKTYSSGNIPDYNKYDKMMNGLRHLIESRLKKDDQPYYLIGTKEDDFLTLKHEYAHALWGVNPQYSNAQGDNIDDLDKDTLAVLKKNLTKMGYGEAVHDDEVQAYLSTGVETMKDPKDKFYTPLTKRQIGKIAEPFRNTFIEFSKGKLPRKKI
jgi:hypothetical protein